MNIKKTIYLALGCIDCDLAPLERCYLCFRLSHSCCWQLSASEKALNGCTSGSLAPSSTKTI